MVGLAALITVLPTGLFDGGAHATESLPVYIVSSANPVDAELPFVLTAKVVSAGLPLFYNWTDSLGDYNSESTWQMDVEVPGQLTVTLQVTDASGEYGEASLTVWVLPPPSVTVSSPLAHIDAGTFAPFFIAVEGGVPPLTVNWTPVRGSPNGTASWPVDGNYSEEVNFSGPGSGWILVHVTDARGDSTSANTLVTQVVAPGSIALATNGSVAEVGWPLGVAVTVEQGAPPFEWTLSSTLPLAEGPTESGLLTADGTYRANISFAFPGVALLNLTVADAAGVLRTATTAVVVESGLSLQVATPGWQSTTPFVVRANLSGGVSPYTFQFRFSDGETSNGTLASAGFASASFDPTSEGNYSVEVRVKDDLGQIALSTEFVRVDASAAPDPAVPSSGLAVYGGLAALALLGLLLALYTFHRFRKGRETPASPGNSALPTVRQLLQRNQIIDRETLLLLCEEEGELLEAAQSALRLLIRTGEVTTEPGPTHDEVLRWKGTERDGPPGETP
jgi:hypothetical protein